MTIDDVITAVRLQVQDGRTPYRYSDATLLNFVNQILKRIAILRPDLFYVVGEITTTADAAVQTLPSSAALRLVELFYVKNSTALVEVDRDALNRSYKEWTTDASGTPTKWARHARSPITYFLSPKPSSGVVLIGQYAQWPQTYTLTSSTITELSEGYFPCIVDGVVFLTESIDAEHADSGRAQLFFNSFMALLGQGAKSRVLTDSENAGISDQPATQSEQPGS